MNNLEKFGVQELDAKEMRNIDGGAIITVYGAIEAAYEGCKRAVKWVKNLF